MSSLSKKTLVSLVTLSLCVPFISFAEVADETEAESCLLLPRTLALGSRGAAVGQLQTFLKEQGFYNGGITNSFGNVTKRAVQAFQAYSIPDVTADDIEPTYVSTASARTGLANAKFVINQTGQTGPATRAKIAHVSCEGLMIKTSGSSAVAPAVPTLSMTGGEGRGYASSTEEVAFAWAVTGATSYKFKLDAPGYDKDKEYEFTTTTWKGTLASLGVTSGVANLSVKACNASSCSAYSTPVQVTIGRRPTGLSLPAPSAPTLRILSSSSDFTTDVSNGSIAANESIKVDTSSLQAANSVNFYLQINGVEKGPFTDGQTNTLAAFGFIPGMYTIKIKGCNDVGTCSAYAQAANLTVTAGVLESVPLISTLTSTLDINPQTVKLNEKFAMSIQPAQVPSSSMYYEYKVNDNAFMRVADLYKTASGVYIGGSYAKTPSELGLSSGQTYTLSARSCTSSGCGPLATKSLTIPAVAVPAVSRLLVEPATVTTIGDLSISLQPAEIPDSSYYYEYKINDGPFMKFASEYHTASGVYMGGSNAKTATALGLVAGQTYKITARTCNTAGCGPVSEKTLTVTSRSTAKTAPTISLLDSPRGTKTYVAGEDMTVVWDAKTGTDCVWVTVLPNGGIAQGKLTYSPFTFVAPTAVGDYSLAVSCVQYDSTPLAAAGINFKVVATAATALRSTAPVVLGALATCTDIPRNLHRGAESVYVTKLQEFLSSNGLLSEKPTGFYGDKTVEAVKDYQARKGLPVTGMLYEGTRATILEESCQ